MVLASCSGQAGRVEQDAPGLKPGVRALARTRCAALNLRTLLNAGLATRDGPQPWPHRPARHARPRPARAGLHASTGSHPGTHPGGE